MLPAVLRQQVAVTALHGDQSCGRAGLGTWSRYRPSGQQRQSDEWNRPAGELLAELRTQPGIPAPQTMWAADGRAGGAPDPRTAGPAMDPDRHRGWIAARSGGDSATPANYEQNIRSITIGSVAVHGLWLGPAERADAIVDFSQFAGKTLILYNDAPAPAPAIDSRLDYFTGDGDQTPIGGAPNTPARLRSQYRARSCRW